MCECARARLCFRYVSRMCAKMRDDEKYAKVNIGSKYTYNYLRTSYAHREQKLL